MVAIANVQHLILIRLYTEKELLFNRPAESFKLS